MPRTPSYGRIATTYSATIPAVTSHPVFKFFPRVKNNLQPAPKVTDIYIPFAPFRMQSLFGIESWRENFVPADYGGYLWNAQGARLCMRHEMGPTLTERTIHPKMARFQSCPEGRPLRLPCVIDGLNLIDQP